MTSKTPVRVAVTGAAGQIGYAVLFRIASGEMLGKDQPKLLLTKQDQIIWYPSLQPVGDKEAISNKYTSLSMGKEARLFYKVQTKDTSYYVSEYAIKFKK